MLLANEDFSDDDLDEALEILMGLKDECPKSLVELKDHLKALEAAGWAFSDSLNPEE
jgi:hypothetical protein